MIILFIFILLRMITENQISLLNTYRDRSFINSILAEQSYNYYNWIKNIINIPLIICNTGMVAINGSIENQELLKILNIILNSFTGLILSFTSQFKIYEHINQYKIIQSKFNKLSHLIDNKLVNNTDDLTTEFINNIIQDYDDIVESIEFNYPTSIRNKIKKQYEGKMTLPSVLAVDIVECKSECCTKV
jgi:hypothetical protein